MNARCQVRLKKNHRYMVVKRPIRPQFDSSVKTDSQCNGLFPDRQRSINQPGNFTSLLHSRHYRNDPKLVALDQFAVERVSAVLDTLAEDLGTTRRISTADRAGAPV